MSHVPFPYQVQSCDTFAARAREGKRNLLQCLPCGAGKTTVFTMMGERAIAKGRKMMIAAHQRKLVRQISERFMSSNIPYTCMMADLPDEPWAARNPNAPIIVASAPTLFARRHSEGIPQVDTLGVDEAHLYNRKDFQAISRLTGHKILLGLTATPCETNGSGLSNELWDSLDTIITIEELIALNRLCSVSTKGPLKLMERRKKGQRTGKAGDPVEQWKSFADGLRTVVFSANVSKSMAVCAKYMAAGIPAAHVDAHTPDETREQIYADVATGKILILCSDGLWKLGVDIPSLECCQLLTAAISPRVFWQGVGRIQRVSEGKSKAVLLDHSGATAVHGLPNTSPKWSLSSEDSVQAREREKQEKDPAMRPRLCKNCGTISAGSGKCPECGALLIHIVKADETTDRENLQDVNEDPRNSEEWSNIEGPLKEWRRLLFITAAQGKTCAVASSMFKAKFGQWPEAAGVRPLPQREDTRSLVRDVFPQFDRRKAVAS